eukprot:749965-Hanusia_phi.AAC.2
MSQDVASSIPDIRSSILLCTELIENSFSDVITTMHEAGCSEEEIGEILNHAKSISENKKRLRLLEAEIQQIAEGGPDRDRLLEQLKD